MTMKYLWQELYQAALLEVQSEELQRRIDAAEKAIYQRIEELKQSGPCSSVEQQALADASRALRVMAQTECQSQPSVESGEPQNEVRS
jgi:hypothetical protein